METAIDYAKRIIRLYPSSSIAILKSSIMSKYKMNVVEIDTLVQVARLELAMEEVDCAATDTLNKYR